MPAIIKKALSTYWKFIYEQRRRRAEYFEARLGSTHPLSIKYIRKALMTLPKIHAHYLK